MPYQPFLGMIMPFAGVRVPNGWALCNGQLMAIQTNSALFSLLGTYFGGNGVSNFALPDLRGRAILGASSNVALGTVAGSVNVTLLIGQLPAHNHAIQVSGTNGQGRGAAPAGHLFGVNTAGSPATGIFTPAGILETPTSSGTNVQNDGGGLAHNNMQPYLAINYLIALNGIYPSRS
jgi:microcystin-dependent protein